MAQRRIMNIEFPLKGMDKKFAYQKQPPYTSVKALNVRNNDPIKGRMRGGSRPGIDKTYPTELGSGNPVRFLNSVQWVNDTAYNVWTDLFNGTAIGDLWEAIGSNDKPSVTDNLANVSYDASSGEVALSALSDFDSSQSYTIEIYIVPYNGAYYGKYQLFGMMDASSPDPTNNGFVVEFTITGTGGLGAMTLTKYSGGSSTSVDSGTSTVAYASAGWLTVNVTGTTVKGYFKGEELVSGTVSGLTGTRQGFGMECTVAGGMQLVDVYRTKYYKTSAVQARRNLLLASSNGILYKEGFSGGMDTVTTSLTLASNHMLQGAPYLQKMYIADYDSARIDDTDGTVTGTVLSDTGASKDWSTYGISANDDVVVISNGSPSSMDGTYTIASVAAGGVTLNTAPGNGTCSYRIERGPKIYTPSADTLTLLTATAGDAPTGCPLICTYRDRIVLAGAAENPHLWYMSRQGTPTDWDTGQTDSAAAVAGNNSDAGQIGEPILALIPHSDDYLVFGCQNSLWVLRGDPAWGGMISNLSYKAGVVDKQAWCKGPSGEIIFLSKDGLYGLSPGAQSYPQPISRELLPEELLDVSNNIYTVTLAYDIRFRGVHIYLSSENNQTVFHWWFDWDTKTFWQVSLEGNYDPTALHEFYSDNDSQSIVLLGGRDGYIRNYSVYNHTDGGNQISSEVKIGPIRLGGSDYYDGLLSEIHGVLGVDSGDVDWTIHVSDTAEGTVTASAFQYSGTWQAGLNYADHPRARGGSMILKLSGAESKRWSLERITTIVEQAGRSRKL